MDITGRITTAIMGLIIILITARIFTLAVVAGTMAFVILMITADFTTGTAPTMGMADISPAADTVAVSMPEAAVSLTVAADGQAALRTAALEAAGTEVTGNNRC